MAVQVEFLKDGRRARVLAPIEYNTIGRHHGFVPVGFETDFASVPRFFWRVAPPWGRYLRAAVVHDYLYYAGTTTRADADKTFLLIMEVDGVAAWRRNMMYWAVRAFGWISWNKHRGNDGTTD